MIDQELYIKILELFDNLEQEAIFKEYKLLEKKLLNDSEVTKLINEYNELSETLTNIGYQSYVDETNVKLEKIKEKLHKFTDYDRYCILYNECNNRLVDISKIIFTDIIGVNEVDDNESK